MDHLHQSLTINPGGMPPDFTYLKNHPGVPARGTFYPDAETTGDTPLDVLPLLGSDPEDGMITGPDGLLYSLGHRAGVDRETELHTNTGEASHVPHELAPISRPVGNTAIKGGTIYISGSGLAGLYHSRNSDD